MDGGELAMGLSTHVLDTSRGAPAAGIAVTVARWSDARWRSVATAVTDRDGRCLDLLAKGASFEKGRYRIRFEIAAYFEQQGQRPLYPYVEIVFEVADERHYHMPLLVTANGFTTYRGS